MFRSKIILKQLMLNQLNIPTRTYAAKTNIERKTYTEPTAQADDKFETVFSFPFVKKIALFSRLKIYKFIGTTIAIPSCAILESFSVLPSQFSFVAGLVGVTGTALLALASIPTKNTIGFIYISDDEKEVKISSIDFWGRRQNRIIRKEDWIPLFDLPSRNTDILYLTPQLTDGTKYKLFVKFGNVLNAQKMGRTLD